MTDDKPDALVKAPAGKTPVAFGLMPSSIDDAFRFAQALARSSLVPKNYQGKPDDLLVAMELGAELGLAPMAAIQTIAVINGRPTIYGDGLLAVIVASPLYVDHAEYYAVGGIRRDALAGADLVDTTAAICAFWRRGRPDPTIREFSIADAKRAGLWGKDGPWQTYPARMLRMRARSWAIRDTFPDLLRGLRAAEEVIDEPADETPAPRRVPRLSDARPADDLHAFVDRTNATRLADPPAEAVDDLADLDAELARKEAADHEP